MAHNIFVFKKKKIALHSGVRKVENVNFFNYQTDDL